MQHGVGTMTAYSSANECCELATEEPPYYYYYYYYYYCYFYYYYDYYFYYYYYYLKWQAKKRTSMQDCLIIRINSQPVANND